MSDVVIRAEHLSKSYQYGTVSHGTLHKDLQSWWARLRGKEDPNTIVSHTNRPGQSGERFWALHDISFDVHQGEIVGIIGRNGAGKSTLLKILSEITTPTRGCAKLKGRVGSLLEVGTGFHPELTGRENIYLNGAILGMSKHEITKKFDEIVAFAEIEEFIDTPVKRYSSGMYVRLAFAVAAHLEQEILLIDEVLAVGDLAFQKKCLGKMGDVAHKGRTVLFVSHNMQAIRALCPRSILLDEGGILVDAPTATTVETYHARLKQMEIDENTDISNPENRRGSGAVRFTNIHMEDTSGRECSKFMMGSTLRFVLSFRTFMPVDRLLLIILVRSGISNEVVTSTESFIISGERLPGGYTDTVIIEFPNVNLRPGEYPLYFWLGERPRRPFDIVDDLTLPLIIVPNQKFVDSGFDASKPYGFFDIESRMMRKQGEVDCYE